MSKTGSSANPLYAQVVTLYHRDAAAQSIRRVVLRGVFLDTRRRGTVSETGGQEAGAFLLIVPEQTARFGVDYTLAPQDKLFAGEGPEVSWQAWAQFAPATVPGLAVVQYVDPKTRRGAPCHLEAGGWWTKGGSGAHSLT